MHLFWTNTNTIFFVFVLTLEVPKKISLKTYEIMYGFGRKENTEGFVVVLWAKVVLKMLFTHNNNKKECDYEHRKAHDLI
jgi:hypothetical protein